VVNGLYALWRVRAASKSAPPVERVLGRAGRVGILSAASGSSTQGWLARISAIQTWLSDPPNPIFWAGRSGANADGGTW